MKKRAVLLLSGGLDSQLALRLMQQQGIGLFALNFHSAFHVPSDAAEKAASKFSVPLKKVDFTDQLLARVKTPKYGHGSGLNPCVDCRIIEFNYAKEHMREVGAEFVVSGEVLGSRPMSQRMPPLQIIEKESGLEGYIVRPLSAKLLSASIPEEKGWVDRSQLLDIKGRCRQAQMKLARELGVTGYPTPAGGCLLTEKFFALRLEGLLEENPGPSMRDLYLLRVGRHFFSAEGKRFVISRHQQDDEKIRALIQPQDIVLELRDYPGPTVLIPDHTAQKQTLHQAGVLLARFSKARDKERVMIKSSLGEFEVLPAAAAALEQEILRV